MYISLTSNLSSNIEIINFRKSSQQNVKYFNFKFRCIKLFKYNKCGPILYMYNINNLQNYVSKILN